MKTFLPITLGLLLALTAGASARTDGGGGSTAAPQPASAGDMRLVVKDVSILDADGAELRRSHCEWTEPQDDDRPCLAFSGDPQSAYREIRDAGGSRARVATRVPDLGIDTRTAISQRGDGTWLFRTTGTVDGKPWFSGHVCSADGRTCSSYDASSERRARRAIKAASARVEKRVRARS